MVRSVHQKSPQNRFDCPDDWAAAEMRLRLKCGFSTLQPMHVYEVRPRKDKRGVDLISDALPFGRLWYDGPNAASNAIGYARHYSRSHGA